MNNNGSWRVFIPYAIAIGIILIGFTALRSIFLRLNDDQTNAFVLDHLKIIFEYMPDSQILTIEIYETDDETYVYITYLSDHEGSNEKSVIATMNSKKRLTQATQSLYPEVMESFMQAQIHHSSRVIYDDEEIQLLVDRLD